MSDIVSRLRAASFPACPDPDFDDASDPAVCDDAADEIELLRELLRKRDGGKLMHGPEENRRDLLDVLVEALDGADRVIVETWNALHEMDAHYLDAPELLRAITARAKQDLASWEDRDDEKRERAFQVWLDRNAPGWQPSYDLLHAAFMAGMDERDVPREPKQ